MAAGRRIDTPGATPARFPLAAEPRVRAAAIAALREAAPALVVSSAACGADLSVATAADSLGIRHRLVLPFPPPAFRAASVSDRPGDWGPLFDRLLAKTPADVVVLDPPRTGWPDLDRAPYIAANERIMDEALRLAAATSPPRPLILLIAWDGASRGDGDITADLRSRALAAGAREIVIDTR